MPIKWKKEKQRKRSPRKEQQKLEAKNLIISESQIAFTHWLYIRALFR